MQVKQTNRNLGGNVNGHQPESGPASQKQAENSTKGGEQNSLCQQLAHHAPRTRAEGRARCKFFSASIGASENEVSNVGASDEQDESNKRHEDERERGHEAADPRFGT